MNYTTHISRLLPGLTKRTQPNKEDQLWNAWLDLSETRGPSDLEALLKSDVRREFKARALVVLMAPDLRVLPFRWDDAAFQNYTLLNRIELKTLPQDLVSFVGQLACQNIDYALGQQDWDIRGTLFEYNKLILRFLVILPEDDELAKQLFSRYQINDPVAYANMDTSSGYNPFCQILNDPNVPIKWKWLADKQMRERIAAEIGGRERPRENWEVALRRYTDHIQMANYDGRAGYPRELFVSQIRFVTELPGIESYDQELFSPWQTIDIMRAIPGDDLHETRHKLARLIVLRKTEGMASFSVCNPKSRQAADLMLREFGAKDNELAVKLTLLIAEADRREVQYTEAQHKKQRKADDVLSQMK